VTSAGVEGGQARAHPLCVMYDVALLDLDGVVYVGADPVPGAVAALKEAASAGMRLAYVTNNAARPASVVREHLAGFGLTLDVADVVTSAQAAAAMLVPRLPQGSSVATVGGPGVAQALLEQGFRPVALDDSSAVAVVMGYGPDVSWRDLAAASFAVQRGALFVATNTDRTIPLPQGIAPGNGMLVEAVVQACGQRPLVAGKPEPTLFREAVTRTGARRPLVVGDRLDTDIEGAVNAGLPSLLVLTGVTSSHEAVMAPLGSRPTYVATDLSSLLEPVPLVAPDANGTSWTCGGWSASIAQETAGPIVHVRPLSDAEAPTGDISRTGAIEAIRAACGAAWGSPEQVVAVTGLG